MATMPTLHMNGDSFVTLFEGHCEVAELLRETLSSLRANAPNARNYYVQGSDAFACARDEHMERVRKIESVLSDVEAILESLVNQHDAR